MYLGSKNTVRSPLPNNSKFSFGVLCTCKDNAVFHFIRPPEQGNVLDVCKFHFLTGQIYLNLYNFYKRFRLNMYSNIFFLLFVYFFYQLIDFSLNFSRKQP